MKNMDLKLTIPKFTEKQIAKETVFSDFTIESYKNDINVNCPYKKKKGEKNFPWPFGSHSNVKVVFSTVTHENYLNSFL